MAATANPTLQQYYESIVLLGQQSDFINFFGQ